MNESHLALLVDDSPVLELTERERRFAVAYFEVCLERATDLGSALPAYRRAFPSADIGDENAHRLAQALARNERVREMVHQLRREYSQRAAVPDSRISEQIERVAFATLADFTRVNEETGTLSVDLRGVSNEQMAAIKEITEHERVLPDGTLVRRCTLKLHSNVDALKVLAQIRGMVREPAAALTLDDVRRAIDFRKRKLGMVIDAAE